MRNGLAWLLGLLLSLLLALPLTAAIGATDRHVPLQESAPLLADAPSAARDAAAIDSAEPGVSTCRMGVFIEDLRDFNFAEKSLFASLRIWSVCPSANLTPLADLEISNANELNKGEIKTRFEPNHSHAFPGKKGLYWSEIGVTGSFYYRWSAQNFPFDRHHLSFEIVPRGVSQGEFLVTPDYQNSGFIPRVSSSDWIASDFLISEQSISQ